MPYILETLLFHHDFRFILVAAAICAFGAASTMNVAKRLLQGRRHLLWLTVVSVCSGATVWATHFVAMLAYRHDVAMTYDPGLTVLSLALGSVIMGLGFHFATSRSSKRPFRLVGGATVGLGVSVLHYVGMEAVRMTGHFAWTPALVVTSIVLSLGFGALALLTGLSPRRPHAILLGSVLMVVMTVSLHFTAMGAAHLVLVEGAPSDGLAREGLAMAVAIAAFLVLVIGFGSAAFDQKISRQAAEAMALIRASEARFRAIFDHAALGITVIDSDTGIITGTNAAFRELLGYEEHELIGKVAATFSPVEDAVITREPVRNLRLKVRDSVTVEKRFVRKDGQTIWGNLTISRVDGDGAEGGRFLVGMLEDITLRKNMEAQLTHQAFHDSLTGLANRALFRDRIEHALARTASDRARSLGGDQNGGLVVMFLDVDRFKHVNDSLGHATGDRLLTVVGSRIAGCLLGSDTVARLGGDEFGILLESDEDPILVAERILAALRSPIMLDGRSVIVSASIGISQIWPGDDTDALLRSADAAMYAAKANGKGRFAVYDPDMHRQALERIQLEEDLRGALDRREFELHYQPFIGLESRRVYGAEALIRWRHPKLGLISPAHFIPVAEETGLIIPLGYWIINEACRQAGEWLRSRTEGNEMRFYISVNLSARQLQDDALIAQISRALRKADIPAQYLCLEITESAVMQDVDAALHQLQALKGLGVGLAIDDFGTGYSSLSQLRRFPFDALKIDKSFVDSISRAKSEMTPAAAKDAALVRMIVALGHALGMRVVAEGIEEGLQDTVLHELGCEMGQGFHYSRPLPPAQFAEEVLAIPARKEASASAA